MNKITTPIIIFFLSFIICCHYSYAQPAAIQWGKVSERERNLKECEYDKSASAVVLGEIGEVELIYGNEAYIRIHRRIKILNEKGLSHSNVVLAYYTKNDLENITKLRAQTINGNGKKGEIIKVDSDQIFDVKVEEDWKEKRFTFPAVKVGSILEYSYTQSTKNLTFLDRWAFQRDIPILYSEFGAKISDGLDYRILYQGSRLIRKYKEGSHRKWVLENLPAIEEEPYSMNYLDYVEKIRFQLAGYNQIFSDPYKPQGYVSTMHTWEKLTDELLTHQTFSQYLRRHSKGRSILESIINPKDSNFEKGIKIYDFVKREIKWDGEYSFVPSKNISELLESKSGNSADINLLLTLLLDEAELESFPVLISTRRHGKVMKEYPFLTQFNHLINYLKIGTDEYFLDATDLFRPFNLLSQMDLVEEGFVLDKSNPRWASIKNKNSSGVFVQGMINLSDKGSVNCKYNLEWKGYEALFKRKMLNNGKDGIKKIIDWEALDFSLDSFSVKNQFEIDKPLTATFNLSQNGKNEENLMYFNPIYLGSFTENPFKADSRQFPIDFGNTFTNFANMIIKTPKSYRVENLPKNLLLKMPSNYGEFSFQIKNEEDHIQIIIRTSLNQKTIPVEEYPSLKQFFDLMINKLKEPIVFKKL